MESPSSGVEFRTSYSLLLGKHRGGQTRMASRGRREATEMPSLASRSGPEFLERELMLVDTEVLNKMKIFMVGESSNRDNFLQPLKQLKDLLERVVVTCIDHPESLPSFNTHIRTIYNFVAEKLLPYLPKIKQSQKEMCLFIVDVLCFLNALDPDSCLTFPGLFASCLLYFQQGPDWSDACEEVVERLCHYVLPNCIGKSQYLCISSVLMIVLESCSSTKDHLLLIDTLMQLKKDVCIDILTVITYGTSTVRPKALDLLLHYWPIPIPEFPHHSHIIYGEWTTPNCENSTCRHSNNRATMLCLDVACVVQHKTTGPTNLYILLCPDCDTSVHDSTSVGDHKRVKLPMPLREIKPNCEFQRICSGKENKVNKAVVTCYDDSCTAIQNGQPIRMCLNCHTKQHKDVTDPSHIFQVGPPDPWVFDDLASSSTMLEAISKLIEVVPTVSEWESRSAQRGGTTPRLSTPHVQRTKPMFMIDMEISRKGLWLLSHFCTPTTTVRPNQRKWLIHLLALVLEWLQSYYDILQQAIVMEEEQLTSVGAASVAAGAEGQEWIDSGLYDFAKIFFNYSEVSTLIDSHILYWIRSVCATNTECMVEVLQPDLPGCAQVGRMWNKSHDSISRSKRTLSIIYRLNSFNRDGKLDSFTDVFNTVMPLWLEKLIQLRTEPGKMEGLQDQFRLIFSYTKHEQGMKTFSFIWERFRSQGSEKRQKGLFWLQDLTRLGIPIPYLPHMFEDALKESRNKFQKMHSTESPSSSFDIGVEEEIESGKKDSTGSMSGYESEPHLLSQSSMEQPDTQLLVNLNSSLARYILMLDIWLSQLTKLSVPTLEFSVFQKNLVKMLRKVWGSNHSPHDHRESSNMCFLCHGIALWFSLVTKLLAEYSELLQRENSAGEDFEDTGSPTRSSRISARSVKLRQIISTPLRSRKGASTSDGFDMHAPRPGPKPRKHSADLLGLEVPLQKEPSSKGFGIQGGLQAIHSGGQTYVDDDSDEPKSKNPHSQHSPFQRRKIAQVQSHSQFQVLTSSGSGMGLSAGAQVEGQDKEATPTIYTIFQLCAMKIPRTKLHPDTLLKIVTCLTALIRDWRVLDICDNQNMVLEDITKLFTILWKSLESSSSNTSRACVDLLLQCAEHLAAIKLRQSVSKPLSSKEHHSPASARFQIDLSDSEDERGEKKMVSEEERKVEDELLWVTIQNGLTSAKWSVRFRAVENFAMMVQFMRRQGLTEREEFHSKVRASLAHGFCLLVQLLLDKNSNVCTRAKYLISSIKESSLEAMKSYLKDFFIEHPSYQTEVLNTFSVLDSSLPELNFLSVDILTSLLTSTREMVTKLTESERQDNSLHVALRKKASDASILSGAPSPKLSTHSTAALIALDNNPVTLKITEKILSLLLRHLANPRADMAESMKKNASQRPGRKAGTIKGRRSTPTTSEESLFQTIRHTVFNDLNGLPQDLRKSPVLEVFLNHMFPVLDQNSEFGQTKELLPFLLKLLCFCAAPTQAHYDVLEEALRDPHSQLRGCPYSLCSLPPHLQAPWLRIFFVIQYKYIHDYSEVDPRSHYQGWEMLTLTQWCLQITLNTLEAEGHDCSLAMLTDFQSRPSLHRQLEVDSIDSPVGEVPTVNIVASSTSNIKLKEALATVPENAEQVRTKPSLTGSSGGDSKSELTEKGESVLQHTPGLCIACNMPSNECTEEVVAIAIVALGTCCHRLPRTVSGYLVPRIIPAVAKVVVPGTFSWQSSKNTTSEPPPGSAMAVAKHILASILTQFGDRRLFLFVFGTDYGRRCQTVFKALAHSLLNVEGEAPADQSGDSDTEESVSQSALIKYFLEDAISSNKELHHYSLINIATYIDILDQVQEGGSSRIQLTKDLILWDNFCKKLKSNMDVLRNKKAMHSFLRVVITLFRNSLDYPSPHTLASYHTHTVQSFSLSLLTVIEFALHNVYCPLGGLVEIAALWYRVFQQHNQREAEKLMKLYINELRKALKSQSDYKPRPDNFLSLIQVLLLEESGYLGYVDGLTTKKCFAPDLKRDYETHCLPMITALQWDFSDVFDFLCARNLAHTEMLPQLKLSLAQLIALRVQHARSPPTGRLKRLVTGDPRALLPTPNTFRSTVIQIMKPQWQDYISAIHLLSWLLLGAMCHNSVDAIAAEMKMEGSVSGQCRLLESLNHKLDEVTQGVLTLVSGVLGKMAVSPNGNFGYLYLAFVFASIWTVYMELYVKNSIVLIVEFWQKFIGRLTHLMNGEMEENYRREVIQSLNDLVVMRLKKINLSCYALLVPIWREVTITVADVSIVFPDIPKDLPIVSVDTWFKETLKELITIEEEWQSDIPT